MEDIMDFDNISISPLLWRRDQDAGPDMCTSDTRRRLNVLGNVRRLSREEHHVEFINIDAVRYGRCRDYTAKRIAECFGTEARAGRGFVSRLSYDGTYKTSINGARD